MSPREHQSPFPSFSWDLPRHSEEPTLPHQEPQQVITPRQQIEQEGLNALLGDAQARLLNLLTLLEADTAEGGREEATSEEGNTTPVVNTNTTKECSSPPKKRPRVE